MTELTSDQIGQVRDDYRAYVAQHGIASATVAKQIDVSPTTISQFVAGIYQGDNQRIARALNDWMELDARRRKSRIGVQYVPTRVAEEMRGLIEIAIREVAIGIIVSEPGTGKSLVLKVMAEKYHAVEIYGEEDLRPGSFIRAVAAQLGMTKRKATTYDMMHDVIDRLTGTNRPVFIDEAQRLPLDVLARLRTMHDRASIPIILAGTDEIISRVKDIGNGRGQFSSRCVQFKALDQYIHSDEDPGRQAAKDHLYTVDEVRQYLQSMSIRFDNSALMFAWALACKAGEGSLRLVKRIVAQARPYEHQRETPVTARELAQIVQQMYGGSQGGYLIGKAKDYVAKYKVA